MEFIVKFFLWIVFGTEWLIVVVLILVVHNFNKRGSIERKIEDPAIHNFLWGVYISNLI